MALLTRLDSSRWWPQAWLAAIGCLLLAAGCTRTQYRVQADREAYGLVGEKSFDPRWGLPQFTLNMDRRSRYYDPTDPDRPPMPQDDPASHEYMHRVDGKRGWPFWHKDGDRWELQNPAWREELGLYADFSQDGPLRRLLGDYYDPLPEGDVRLSIDSALALGLIHSPSYRSQLETIYLSALDVSAERFRFDTQFFGSIVPAFAHNGRLRPGGETNALSVASDLTARRRFATGGELLVGFANSFVWQFAGPDTNATVSLIDFNLVQPLLRAGGRAVALEQLTIVERTLLANLRAFQRYRQGFYTEIAVGDSSVESPQRRGGFFGGTGLTGFTGQGSGGFGGVGGATGFGRAGFGGDGGGGGGGGAGFVGGGAGTVGGVLGLLQQLQQLRNSEDSLNANLRTLPLLQAHFEAGTIDKNQVDLFRQNIKTAQANLLQSRNALINSIETLKRSTLGLPPDLPVDLDESPIAPLQLTSPRMTRLQGVIAAFLEHAADHLWEVELPDREAPLEQQKAELTRSYSQLRAAREKLVARADEFAKLPAQVDQQIVPIEGDLTRLDEVAPRRVQTLSGFERQAFVENRRQLSSTFEELTEQFAAQSQRVQLLRDGIVRLVEPPSLPDEVDDADVAALVNGQHDYFDQLEGLTDQLVEETTVLASIVQELWLVQVRSRVEAVTLDDVVELDPQRALAIARAYRLDWMNNRAALVDTWRLITFNANALLSGVDIVFAGDMSTTGNNPMRFRAPTGTLRAGLRFDAPLTRLLERNNYRQVLIDYQRDRRQLIQYEDRVNQSLRQLLRQLEQLRENLEIQRGAVAIAADRVDQSYLELSRPPGTAAPGEPAVPLSPTSAFNLLTALNDLQGSQNNFMSVWLNYYATRMVLMRELGVMELDENGVWIDLPLSEMALDVTDPCPLPPGVPDHWFEALEQGEPVPPTDQRSEPLPTPRADEPTSEATFDERRLLFEPPQP